MKYRKVSQRRYFFGKNQHNFTPNKRIHKRISLNALTEVFCHWDSKVLPESTISYYSIFRLFSASFKYVVCTAWKMAKNFWKKKDFLGHKTISFFWKFSHIFFALNVNTIYSDHDKYYTVINAYNDIFDFLFDISNFLSVPCTCLIIRFFWYL